MKRTKSLKSTAGIALGLLLSLTVTVTGCMEKDLYNPDAEKNKLPTSEEYFGFETRSEVALNVNYNAPGFKAIIEVYDQNPLQEGKITKKEGVKPVFTAYTDDNGKYEGKMYIPTAVTEAYLYTDRWGLPTCVKLTAGTDGWTYDVTKVDYQQRIATKAGRKQLDQIKGSASPYSLSGHTDDNLYTLALFDAYGHLSEARGFSNTLFSPGYVSTTTSYNGELLGNISRRVETYYDKYNGKKTDLLKSADITNIKVTKAGSLDVIYLTERAQYYNTLGYYYYEAGNAPKTEADFKAIKKYIVIPNAFSELNVVKAGDTYRLKYFGKDGLSAGVDEFPANTVVGWFIVSNGFLLGNGVIIKLTSNPRNIFYSNDIESNMRFVSVKDQKSGLVVLGCEDQPEIYFDRVKEDYSDLLFFVKSDDGELENEGKPTIPDPDQPTLPDGSVTVSGTLAFEDIWPFGGDYDLNDVVVEYERTIKYNGDNITLEVTETFRPVQEIGSAGLDNYFAYQIADGLGTVTLPENCIKEDQTNSIVIRKTVSSARNETFVIKRDVKSLNLSTVTVLKNFNPYIIVAYYKETDRTEVHLPKHLATSAADESKINTGKDAYYVDKDGAFPFAIDIPVQNFKVTTESVRIDSDGEYPAFKSWAESKGANDKDWYLKGKK